MVFVQWIGALAWLTRFRHESSRLGFFPVPQPFVTPEAYLDVKSAAGPCIPVTLFVMSLFSVFSAIVAVLSFLDTTCAHTILDDQCWSESTLQTITVQSHKTSTPFRIIEIVDAIRTPSRPAFSFHLPWPWTHQPICTSPLPSIQSPLCIYTSTTFASGRGISIVTTPSLAAEIATFPAFADPTVLEKDGTNKPTNLWFTSSIPGKGTGTLALHNLSPGTQILRYTPAFLAYLEADLATLDREALWSLAVSRLPAHTRTMFMALMYIYGDPRVRVQDIVKGNTFQIEIRGANHLAIFPETSRLNHDCAPNAQYVIDPETLTHTVRVTRAIEEGDEISIAYTSPLEKTAVRREKLGEGFHFECGCARCRNHGASDAVLDGINAMQQQLNDWGPDSQATPEMAQRLVEVYEGEGLQGFLDVPFGFMALALNAAGDSAGARVWAGRARDAVLAKDGKGADALRIWTRILEDAEEHWSYRRRTLNAA